MMEFNLESRRHLRGDSISCSPHLAEHLVARSGHKLFDIPDQNRISSLGSKDNSCLVIGQDSGRIALQRSTELHA